MLLLRTSALWLLLAFVGQQVSLSSGARNKNRGTDKSKPAASGKFSSKDRLQCTWRARDVGDTVTVSVKCEDREARVDGGVAEMKCEYDAKPQSCPGYQSDPKGFWKQVSRAFKRLGDKLCSDVRALVRAGMCKRAPRDAHLKLDVTSSVIAARPGEPETSRAASTAAAPAGQTACTGRAGHRKKAEEHCGSSWASVCSFFFTMLQSDDC